MIVARSVPISEVLRWYVSGWKGLSGYWPKIILFSTVGYALPGWLYWMGFPWTIVAEVLETLLGLGILIALRASAKREPLPMKTLLRGFYDRVLLLRVYPFLILSFIFSIVSVLTEMKQASSSAFSLAMLLISMVLAFVPYLMMFDGLSFVEALNLGLLGVVKNLHGYTVLFLGIGLLLVFLVLPAMLLQPGVPVAGDSSVFSGMDPRFLGYLVLIGLILFPWMSMIAYRSYESIFRRAE